MVVTTTANPNAWVSLDPACGGHHDRRLLCPEARALPERFAIEVTADDIAAGTACSADACPIALALGRWLFEHSIGYAALTVTARDIEVNLNWSPGGTVRLWFDAHGWVGSFDRGEPVQPRTVLLVKTPRPGEPARCWGRHP